MTELVKIYSPISSAGEPQIIFIHGLDGDIRTSWMSNKKDQNTLWPKWVGEDTGCPVWLLGYSAPKTRWSGDAMALQQISGSVLDRFSSEPALMNGPIILIGHSQGGLIIKTLLKQAISQGVSRHERIMRNVKAVVFVGTPHFGSVLASIVAWSHLARPNPGMRDLGLHDANLAALNTEFRKIVRDHNIQTRSYYETQPMRLPWLFGRILPGVRVVSPTSSDPQILGDVAIGIAAHHLNISKPKDKNSAIHQSLISLVHEFQARNTACDQQSRQPIESQSFEAIHSGQRVDVKNHMAFAIYGDSNNANTSICASVCLVTDSPERLRKQILDIWKTIERDPLVDKSSKENLVTASLATLAVEPSVRDIVRRELAEISFSAYLYYCANELLEKMPDDNKKDLLIVTPLTHRMSKKGEVVEHIHVRLLEMQNYLERAAARVNSLYHRSVNVPLIGKSRYRILEELALLVAQACSQHLSELNNQENTALFECLRTRIRFAENVITGEKHIRDKNPLP